MAPRRVMLRYPTPLSRPVSRRGCCSCSCAAWNNPPGEYTRSLCGESSSFAIPRVGRGGPTGTPPREQRAGGGLRTCSDRPRPYGRDYKTTDLSPGCVGVATNARACPITIWCDVREMGVPCGHCGRGLSDTGACPAALWACPRCRVGVSRRRACALGSTGAAMAHGHGPGRCRCCGEEAAERGAAWGLYLRIDRQRLQCLNERREGSGATVFRPWEERRDRSQVRPGAAGGAAGRGGGPAPRLGPSEAQLEGGVRAWGSQERRRSC